MESMTDSPELTAGEGRMGRNEEKMNKTVAAVTGKQRPGGGNLTERAGVSQTKVPMVVGKEGVLDRGSSNCKGLEEKDEEREMYLKCKMKNQKHIGLEIGQRAVARRG